MKKTIALLLIAMLLALICATAIADGCVNAHCTADVYVESQGFSEIIETKHEYGGFLGMFKQTCTVQTIYAIWSYTCGNGHNNGIAQTVYWESHSSCGK